MKNFTFYNPTKIIFGRKSISFLSKLIKNYNKILITYGGGSIKSNGVYKDVIDSLKEHVVIEFSGIEVNPKIETLNKCIDLIKKEKPDFILAVGGGSVIDASKFMAKAALYAGDDAWDLLADDIEIENSIPLGCVLTLPATGSEMNTGAVISKLKTNEKLPFLKCHHPIFAILDPVYTMSLPEKQITNGIADTFVHIMEQYLTYEQNAPIQDGFCETLLSTLIDATQKIQKDPDNYEVRANLMWCATLGLNGLIGAGVVQDWATHMIGHEITALYGLDHAITLSIIMPSLLEICVEDKQDKLIKYGRNVLKMYDLQNNKESAMLVIGKIREFFESLPIKTHFKDYNIDESCMKKIIANLEKHGMIKLGEKDKITPEVVEKILLKSL